MAENVPMLRKKKKTDGIQRVSVPRPVRLVVKGEETISRNFLDRSEIENQFNSAYDGAMVVRPPYELYKLFKVVEQSDVLRSCMDAMKSNVEGFGYDFVWVGANSQDQSTPQAQAQKEALFNFFDSINESEGYTKIAKRKREDLETYGCACFEAVRSKNKKLFALYYSSMMDIRICTFDAKKDVPQKVKIPMKRDGVVKTFTFEKYFKRFLQVLPYTKEVRYFKEFGDPRTMDYKTGEFVASTSNIATELMFFTLPFSSDSVYSLPRWTGGLFDAMGRSASQFLNYDLMDSQGIPPLAVLVTGGLLTNESYNDLVGIFVKSKGRENFNKTLILEAIPETSGLDEKSNVKLDFKNMTDFRKEDQMFGNYQNTSLENVRRPFRLPPLYTGDARSYNLASARSSQLIAEQQIFGPERNSVDEEINRLIVQREFGIYDWEFRSKGPRIVGSEEQALAVEKFSKVGALTINDSIKIANEAFGLNMPTHNEPWANIPIPILDIQMKKFLGETTTPIVDTPPEPANIDQEVV